MTAEAGVSGRAEARVRFAIVCLGRSGSTHLQSLLDSHPDVRCFGEVLSDSVPEGQPGLIHSPHADVDRYLAALFRDAPQPVVGFKLPMNSLRARPEAADAIRAGGGLRAIRLSRRNLLAQLVSRRLLAATGVAHSIQGGYGDATVRIEPARCLETLERMEADERELDALTGGLPTFRLTYEELSEGLRLDELQRFLGVEPRRLRSWFTKVRNTPLRESVENWDELAEGLRDTRFEGFLADAA